MIFDVHLIPASAIPLLFHIKVRNIPARIAMTGPPMTGKAFPNSQDGIAITRHIRIPDKFFFIKFIIFSSFKKIQFSKFSKLIITLENDNKKLYNIIKL